MRTRTGSATGRRWAALCYALAPVVLCLDSVTERTFSAGVLYLPLVLMASMSDRRRTVVGVTGVGVLFTLVVSGVAATVLGLAIKYTIGWRVTEEDEVEGIDFAQHGETAYDLGTSTSRLGGSALPSSVLKEGASA